MKAIIYKKTIIAIYKNQGMKVVRIIKSVEDREDVKKGFVVE